MKKLVFKAMGFMALLSSCAGASDLSTQLKEEKNNYWSERVLTICSFVEDATVQIAATRLLDDGETELFSADEVAIIDPKEHRKPNYVRSEEGSVQLENIAVELTQSGQVRGKWEPTTSDEYEAIHKETGERIVFVPYKSPYMNLYDQVLHVAPKDLTPAGFKFGMSSRPYYFHMTNFNEKNTSATYLLITAGCQGYKSVEREVSYYQFIQGSIVVRAKDGVLKISIEQQPR